MLEDQAGLLIPEECVRAHAELARRNGAEIHEREAVTRWSSDSAGVRLVTERGEYRAKHTVFTSGPWTEKLVRIWA
jgi:glycine/D-amino acid oxidase-like deaminating enzyme